MYVVHIIYDGDTEEWEYTRPPAMGWSEHLVGEPHRQAGRGLGALQRALEQDTVGVGGQFWNRIREEVRVGGGARKEAHPNRASKQAR